MVDSEEEKQNYLRENILDKGYEAEEFVTYLTSKKGDEGVDLGNWSLNELKMVVQEYILTHPKGKIQQANNFQAAPQLQNNFQQNPPLQNPNINNFNNMNMGMNMNQNMNLGMNQNMNMNPNMNMGMNQNMNVNMNPNMNMGIMNAQNMNNMNMGMNNQIINNNLNNQQIQNNLNQNFNNQQIQNNINQNYMSFTPENNLSSESDVQTDIYGITNLETILCSVNEKSELYRYQNIQIEISLGEKVAGKLFTKAYMTYIITTSPLNLKAKRRYSDFEWLRQILLNFYSSSVIPPIPKKK